MAQVAVSDWWWLSWSFFSCLAEYEPLGFCFEPAGGQSRRWLESRPGLVG